VYLHSAAAQLPMSLELVAALCQLPESCNGTPTLSTCLLRTLRGWLAGLCVVVSGCLPVAERESRHTLAFPHTHTPLTPSACRQKTPSMHSRRMGVVCVCVRQTRAFLSAGHRSDLLEQLERWHALTWRAKQKRPSSSCLASRMQGSSSVLWLQNRKPTGAVVFAIGTGHLVMPGA